jgi:hypothetical protein
MHADLWCDDVQHAGCPATRGPAVHQPQPAAGGVAHARSGPVPPPAAQNTHHPHHSSFAPAPSWGVVHGTCQQPVVRRRGVYTVVGWWLEALGSLGQVKTVKKGVYSWDVGLGLAGGRCR